MNKNSFLVVANWKMNPITQREAGRLVASFESEITKIAGSDFLNKVEVVVCPPFPYLGKLGKSKYFKFGAQNIHWEPRGAFTGEVSIRMVEDLGTKFVIIGHSERRINFNETDKTVNLKVLSVLKSSLFPIICVGESLEERKKGQTTQVIAEQIKKALNKVSILNLPKITIAYEPIWAISTSKNTLGFTENTNDIMGVSILIKKIIGEIYQKDVADRVRIIYGGSVNRNNIDSIVEIGNISGVLVGGASLSTFEFLPIIKKAYERELKPF